jgi:trigger factor
VASAPALGAGDREFESPRPDHTKTARSEPAQLGEYTGNQEYVSVKTVAETLSPTRVRLNVEVPFEELKPSIDAAYRNIAGQVNVPGFRRGKVPPKIIDQRFGRGVVLQEAVQDALPKLYTAALEEADVSPLANPDISISELNDGAELKFTAEVDIRPQIAIPDLSGLEVHVSDAEVTDELIDARLEALRERFGSLLTVERAAEPGDFVVIDLKAHRDGESVEGAQATGITYRIGSDTLVPGLDDAVTGLAAGESTTFSTTLQGEHAGQEVDCDVTVTAVKEQELPPLDDEFAQMASEFDTLDELREDIHEQLTRELRMEQALEARDKALEAVLSMVDVPLPDNVIAEQVNEHFADGHGDDEHRNEVEVDIRKGLTTQLVLDEIVKREGVTPAPDELTQFVVRRAAQVGVDPNEYIKKVVEAGNLPALVAEAARAKALASIVENARVIDSKGEVVPLDRLREDGTLADEGEMPGELREAPTGESKPTAEATSEEPKLEVVQIPLGQQPAQ